MNPAARAGQRDQLKRLSVLIAVAGVDMLGFAMVLPLLPFYALKLHATPETIGAITASYSVAQLLAAPLWGRVSDQYGRRPALLAGLLASAAAFAIFGLASAVWLFFAMRLIQGAGGGTTGVAQAYVADTVGPGHRAQALGWLSSATAVGFMLGPVIGSLAARFGQVAPGMVAAALCLLNAGFAWKWLPESKQPPKQGERPVRRPVWHGAWQVVRHPRGPVPRLIWIYAAGMLGFTAMTSVLALYLDKEFGVTEKSIGWVFLYVATLSLVMRSLLLGSIVRRLGEPGTMRLGTICLTLGLVLYPITHSMWVLAPIMALVPIGTALLFPATTALMSHASEKAEVGTTMGVAQTFAGLSRVVAPLIATSAFQRFGSPAPFYLAGAIVLLVGAMAFRLDVAPHALRESDAA
ncbi:MAG TPA: MFS transporter [Gemmatimonadales bacterium]|jgi:MFS family permease|nr:MFS transporter [Gemmatimonadales bacterium]